MNRHLKPLLKSLLVLAIYLPFLAATTGKQYTGPAPEYSARINAFALDLLHHEAAAKDAAQNEMFSPGSLWSCMAMCYIGSAGPTRDGLARALHFPADNESLMRDLPALRRDMLADAARSGAELHLADSMWLDKTYAKFRPDYLRDLSRLTTGAPHEVKFADKAASTAEVNDWLKTATDGRITQGITPAGIPSRSQPARDYIDEPALVAVDAAWFKAKWTHRFAATETSQRLFYTPGAGAIRTPIMHQRSLFLYAQDADFKLLIMPYAGDRFSMIALLPRATADVPTLAASLKENTVKQLLLAAHPAAVDILFPKFTIKRRLDLGKTLAPMGAAEAFDKNRAGFDPMIIKQDTAFRIYLDGVHHESWLQVDEDGTEAAATTVATAYSIGCAAAPEPGSAEFHADHPFLFFIVHNPTRATLFAGWITNPSFAAPANE